jgi:hypothetical protein
MGIVRAADWDREPLFSTKREDRKVVRPQVVARTIQWARARILTKRRGRLRRDCGFQRIADRIPNDRGQRSGASRTRFQTIADSVPMIADGGG